MKCVNIIFMGRKSYAAQMMEWTVQQGIRIAGVVTDTEERRSPTVSMAKVLGLPLMTMEEAEELVTKGTEKVDLVVSYLFWRKIRKPLIEFPTYGCINFHPAILPDWRGTAGYNVAILERLPQWGATAHYVNESIDTGDIIKVFRFDFDYRLETAFSLEKKTQEIQMQLYRSVMLDVLAHGRLKCETQDASAGRYISRKEMEEMKRVDLTRDSAEEVALKIRAFWFPPYDGANIEVNGTLYTLVDRELLKHLARGE